MKVSIIANVTFNALLLFKIVANIYNPFSVKTLGSDRLLEESFVDENFDRKTAASSEDKISFIDPLCFNSIKVCNISICNYRLSSDHNYAVSYI